MLGLNKICLLVKQEKFMKYKLGFLIMLVLVAVSIPVTKMEQTLQDQEETLERIEEAIEFEQIKIQQDELNCLAQNIYWESRNQSDKGRVAVAQVTMNRVNDPRFPSTICGVVKQTKYYPSGRIDLHSCQFSWYCDGMSDEPLKNEMKVWEKSLVLAEDFLLNRPTDRTNGALWYHSVKVNPDWAESYFRVTIIEDHIFYVDNV